MLMHALLRCTKETFSTDFIQCQWNILYGYTFRNLIFIMVYKLVGKFEAYVCVLDLRLQNNGAKTLEWGPKIQRSINMIFRKV